MFKKTEEDLKQFDLLNKSSTGQWLTEYLTRMNDWICDVRSDAPATNEVKMGVAILIEEYLLKPIQGTHKKDVTKDSYE